MKQLHHSHHATPLHLTPWSMHPCTPAPLHAFLFTGFAVATFQHLLPHSVPLQHARRMVFLCLLHRFYKKIFKVPSAGSWQLVAKLHTPKQPNGRLGAYSRLLS